MYAIRSYYADDTTYAYLEGRNLAPKGAEWDEAVEVERREVQRNNFV